MWHMEIHRIRHRPLFWFLVLADVALGLLPVLQMWPHGLTADDYIFYPRSVYVSWMYFGADNIYQIYTTIFPLLASLAYSDAYAEDFNTGLIKGILTKVEKKKYLLTRFFVNFAIGGCVATLPLFINFLGQMAAYPLIDNNYYFGMVLVTKNSFWPDLFYHHAMLYVVVRLILLFLFGGMLASLSLALSTVVKNRYIVLVFPFLVTMALDVLVLNVNGAYSITNIFFWNQAANLVLPLYLVIGILGSFAWFYGMGEKNETI